MHFRIVATAPSGHEYTSRLRSLDAANAEFTNWVREGVFSKVTLSQWVEGAGNWHTIRTHVPDWHSSPLTHSYA